MSQEDKRCPCCTCFITSATTPAAPAPTAPATSLQLLQLLPLPQLLQHCTAPTAPAALITMLLPGRHSTVGPPRMAPTRWCRRRPVWFTRERNSSRAFSTCAERRSASPGALPLHRQQRQVCSGTVCAQAVVVAIIEAKRDTIYIGEISLHAPVLYSAAESRWTES